MINTNNFQFQDTDAINMVMEVIKTVQSYFIYYSKNKLNHNVCGKVYIGTA